MTMLHLKKILLIFHFFYEISLAGVLLFAPSLLIETTGLGVSALILNYAVISAAVASWSLLLLLGKDDRKVWLSGMSALSIFHGALFVSQLMNAVGGEVAFFVPVIHGVLALGFYLSADDECKLDEKKS